MSSNKKFGENKVIFESGGDQLPEPIALKLLPIEEALNPLYFEALGSSCIASRMSRASNSLQSRRANLIQALRNYANWKKVELPKGLLYLLNSSVRLYSVMFITSVTRIPKVCLIRLQWGG